MRNLRQLINGSMQRLTAGVFACLFLAAGVGLFWTNQVGADSLPNTGAPAGFTLNSVAEGLFLPTAAEFAPDGRIFVAQKNGEVLIVKDGQLLEDPFYTVPNVNDYVDRGLLGLALDPNFDQNGHVYLLYTYDNNPSDVAGPKTGQLLRVTANGDVAQPGSEYVVLGTNVGNSTQTSCLDFPDSSDCLPADGLSHAPGSVVFGPDGKLYVSIGDAAGYDDVDPVALRAQDLNTLNGKILRVNPDGTAPADNPYFTGDPTANRSKIYASGVRNAFRLTIRQSDGLVMTGDVGWNTWEEVNVVEPGVNLGWPCFEANDQQNGTGAPGIGAYKDQPFCQAMYQNPPVNLTGPTHQYPHPPSSAVVSGVFYTGDNYPAEYQGRYFYGDYAKNQIYSLELDGPEMVPGSNQAFASNAGGPVNFFTGPDGDIYYLAIMLGGIYHIDYSTENQAPTAFAAADKTYGSSPLTVNFTSSGSSDPENDDLSFEWDFGDGSPVVNDVNPTHTFTADGTYTVTLTVIDAFNNIDTQTLTIHAGQTAPEINIDTPAGITVADPDDVINFSGSATDAQDGPLPASALHWQVVIQHCPLDSCHVHSVLTTTGSQGSFLFPHHDGPFYVEIRLSVTNSSGLTTRKSVSVYPTGQPITHAMQFDGINDYARAAAPEDFRMQEFTAEAMIKTLSTDDWGSEIVSAGNNWGLRVMPNGNLQFSFNSNNTWQNLVANVNARDGLWHHVAVTRTANAVKLYMDGEVVAQSENLNPIEYIYGSEFLVGRHGDGDDHFNFNGAIDEVRVWNVPRSDAQIEQYSSTMLPDGESNLLAHYTAEEGTGTIANDGSSAATHSLTLHNGANWTAGAPLSEPDGEPEVTPVTALTDDFEDFIVDQSKWFVYDPAASSQLQDGELNITPSSVGASYRGISSRERFELKNNALYVEVPQVANPATTAETQFIVEPNESNKIVIGVTGGSLQLRHRVNDVNSDEYIPYDAEAMRWWRIREAAGMVHLETSPDGLDWTTRRSFAVAFNLNELEVILQAGTWEAVANPGVARFDNLNIAPESEPEPSANHALSFDGTPTSQASAAGDDAPNFAYQNLSVETWVKAQATGIWGGEVVSNGNNWGLRILTDGNVRFFIHTGGLVWENYETTGVNVLDDTWHHLAATKDGDSVKIYIDGVIRQTFASPETISYTLENDLVLGRNGAGDDNFNLTGLIDEVRIWNNVRTDAEIQSNYLQELSGSQAGLSAYWQLNSGSGSDASDQSGNGHTITVNPGAGWSSIGFPRQ